MSKYIHLREDDLYLGLYIPYDFSFNDIEFLTKDDATLQIGGMSRSKNYIIDPHLHNVVDRNIRVTHEVLYVKKGKARVNFYTEDQTYIKSIIISTGDFLLLSDGGHGVEILDDCEIIEIKQGPYVGLNDKVRFSFTPIDNYTYF